MANSDSDKNVHGVEKPIKEYKEKKKKKDKVMDASGHAETQPEIAKGTRKKEMSIEDWETSLEPELVPSNPRGKEKKKKRRRDREDEGSPSGDKRKKKRKKEKTSGATSDSPAVPATDSPLETTGTTVAAKEKKKRKKIKSSAETSDPPPSSVTEPIPSVGAADEPVKPRNRKLTKDDAVDVNADAEPSSKSISRSRKRKKEATTEDEGHPSTIIPAEDSSRKRKKSKKSIHPNPFDDSDLTEQSQKALIYIYSQSTSPSNWKFNKARQNWIIRNIWTSKVPEKYVPMVVEYLSKVQGRVRETLIESCNKVVSASDPDPPTVQAATDENGAPEGPNSSSTATKNRTQRAHALLYALTKS